MPPTIQATTGRFRISSATLRERPSLLPFSNLATSSTRQAVNTPRVASVPHASGIGTFRWHRRNRRRERRPPSGRCAPLAERLRERSRPLLSHYSVTFPVTDLEAGYRPQLSLTDGIRKAQWPDTVGLIWRSPKACFSLSRLCVSAPRRSKS